MVRDIFTLDLEEVDGNNTVTASTTFAAIPSATSTRAIMAFTDGTIQNASPIRVDYDGNGTTDFSLESKIGEEIVFDTMPPEAKLLFNHATQELDILGVDNISNTTVSTTATSSIVTDEVGNTLQIIFKKLKEKKKHIKLELQNLSYNSIIATSTPKAVLQYEWSTGKNGELKELEQKAETDTLMIQAHYDAKKNVTKIEEKMKGKSKEEREDRDEKKTKKVLPGLVIIGLTTKVGEVQINY